MEVAAVCLLLLMNSLDSGRARVSVRVVPERSQFFKYDSFSVSCEDEQEEEELTGWRVMKRMEDEEVRLCPPSCSITAAFPATDSGVYWCEDGLGATSSAVNITVTASSVILESPVLPVAVGDDVTLTCRCRAAASPCDLAADFYKDGRLIRTSATGSVDVHSVSRSDEGLYRCRIGGAGDSPESWLTVRAPPAGHDPPAPLLSIFTLVRHLVVGTPYLLSTVLLGLIYRDRKREQQASESGRTCDDVIMQIDT